MENMIEDYVYSIKSEVDVDSFKDSFKNIRRIWVDKLEGLNEALNTKLFGVKTDEGMTGGLLTSNNVESQFLAKLLAKSGITGGGGINDFQKIMKGDFIPTIEMLIRVNKKLLGVAEELTDKSTEIANQLVKSKSMFIDEDIRQMMTTLGVGSNQAIAMSNVLEQMGLGTQDLFQMTPGQVRAYTELMETWTSGMESLDKATMDSFGEQAQEYQLAMAKLDLRKEMAYYKMMVENAPAIERLYQTQLGITENLVEFIEWVSESKLLNVITDLVSGGLKPLKWGGDIASAIGEGVNKVTEKSPILNQENKLTINGVPSQVMVKEIQKAMYTSNAINVAGINNIYD